MGLPTLLSLWRLLLRLQIELACCLYAFQKEIMSDGVIVDPTEVIDGVVPHDEYRDEMDMMTVFEGTQTLPVPELPEDDSSLFEGIVSPIFDIDDEIAHPSSNRDSFDHDSGPIDERVSPAAGDAETSYDFGTEDQPRELKIGSPLSTDERDRLIHYSGHIWMSCMVKEEIQKQLSVGFISVVEYLEWLANVVPVPKKDGKVRVCVDFRDLNKASPKDDFPLPHIDLLVDGTAGHSMLSFMDGFSGYNQILMALEDMEKTTFITEWGTYCYRVMPFGLKNAGATYQEVATTLFHDMMHRDVEVYVDDMIVKSRVEQIT
ncbi:Transposon Ty3-G Gag-Pol polyprotein [Vitis vinifera]|uniref:Transposon Ty3-G Gag-Pol polyprotein n=1 Tax=Vitis vinifera TaxID=29760 RepID=A0A438HWN0_VITVI|nr:Transposon Ty3-G Gag-Pol polyprotein [Vitis vinifera]